MTGQHEPLWKPEVKSGAPDIKSMYWIQHCSLVFHSEVSYMLMVMTCTSDWN